MWQGGGAFKPVLGRLRFSCESVFSDLEKGPCVCARLCAHMHMCVPWGYILQSQYHLSVREKNVTRGPSGRGLRNQLR